MKFRILTDALILSLLLPNNGGAETSTTLPAECFTYTCGKIFEKVNICHDPNGKSETKCVKPGDVPKNLDKHPDNFCGRCPTICSDSNEQRCGEKGNEVYICLVSKTESKCVKEKDVAKVLDKNEGSYCGQCTPAPTASPTWAPTSAPSNSFAPTSAPTNAPTSTPTSVPTSSPSLAPSLSLTPTSAPTETPTPGPTPTPYNIYYGYLHAHTKLSDGSINPKKLFERGENAGLDFLGVSDHDSWFDDMTNSDWSTLQNEANKANDDGNFVTFRGFEWTSDGNEDYWLDHGHFTVTGTPDWVNANTNSHNHIEEFVTWLDNQPDGIAIFNHPGQYQTTFEEFDFTKTDKIVGMELWNRNANYYKKDGYDSNDGFGYYDEALRKGWHIAAGGGQDNHSDEIGTMNDSRMAVLATELTRDAIMDALKNRRFYSVRELNLELTVTFGVEEHPMGSILNIADFSGSHDLTITASGDAGSFNYIDLIKNGEIVQTWDTASNPFQGTYTVDSSTLVSGDYFYVRVSDGANVKRDWKGIGGTIFFN